MEIERANRSVRRRSDTGPQIKKGELPPTEYCPIRYAERYFAVTSELKRAIAMAAMLLCCEL